MSNTRFILMITAVLLALTARAAFAITISVPGMTSPTIQGAINAAVNGDVVVVAPGTYKENIDFKGKAIIVRSTTPTSGAVVAATIIDGSHHGTVVTFKTQETAASALRGFTIINGSGTPENLASPGGGVYCYKSSPTLFRNVITGNVALNYGGGVACYSSSSPTLTSNTISGNAAPCGGGMYCVSGSSPKMADNTISNNGATTGGGMYCNDYSSPVLVNNTISGNEAHYGDGGGLYCTYYSSPLLTTNTISGNTTYGDGDGGGMACTYNASPALTSNIISGNWADSGGGVSCTYNSSPVLTGNTISNNTAKWGGGVHCYYSSPTLTSNLINGNSANEVVVDWWGLIGWGGGGGGVDCAYSSAILTNNTIRGNSANSSTMGAEVGGGGVYCSSSSPTLTNNLITGNSSSHFGGGVHCFLSSPSLTNNTISGNSAPAGGGLWCIEDSSPIIKNTIVADNAAGGGLQSWGATSLPVVTYCDFHGNTGGNFITFPDPTGTNGNIAVDPLFAGPVGGDFRLKSQGGRWTGAAWVTDLVNSPCLDTGDPASVFSLEPSPNGGRINMGFDGNTNRASKSPGPVVIAWLPQGTAVARSANITITFNTSMLRSSAQGSLSINGVKATTLGGVFTWKTNQMTFNPTADLPAGTLETVVVTAARSKTGMRLTKACSWTFTTADARALVTAAAAPTAAGAQITLNLTAAADVTISIRNLAGREIALLTPGQLDAGVHSLLWNGKSRAGTRAPAGRYLVTAMVRGEAGSQAHALTSLSFGQ